MRTSARCSSGCAGSRAIFLKPVRRLWPIATWPNANGSCARRARSTSKRRRGDCRRWPGWSSAIWPACPCRYKPSWNESGQAYPGRRGKRRMIVFQTERLKIGNCKIANCKLTDTVPTIFIFQFAIVLCDNAYAALDATRRPKRPGRISRSGNRPRRRATRTVPPHRPSRRHALRDVGADHLGRAAVERNRRGTGRLAADPLSRPDDRGERRRAPSPRRAGRAAWADGQVGHRGRGRQRRRGQKLDRRLPGLRIGPCGGQGGTDGRRCLRPERPAPLRHQ